jgi:ABC-type nitrate/sulfonate/bicarbonate transport system ATPase subunit
MFWTLVSTRLLSGWAVLRPELVGSPRPPMKVSSASRHMSVAENVAYGLRVRKLPKVQIAEAVERALDLVQMRALADRSAALLSGGQQQRVALARAIAFSPAVLFFDEPLSNLDAKLRAEMRVELRALQRRLGVTSLYVTHDQEGATTTPLRRQSSRSRQTDRKTHQRRASRRGRQVMIERTMAASRKFVLRSVVCCVRPNSRNDDIIFYKHYGGPIPGDFPPRLPPTSI